MKKPTAVLAEVAVALGAAASVAALGAPTASAAVTGITVAPGRTIGLHDYGTGCSYTVTATVDDSAQVYFFEEGQGPTGFADATPVDGTATVTWTPSRTATTYLFAAQAGGNVWPRVPVDVGTGINLGSACVAL
ncbi:hypothetical protein [Nocardia sp. NPDC057227]|uniref:hypothetical protein n=1 Tax=Nocardia sp. NPDC057227 TaxID=3346056 RepID=UPI00362CF561